MYIENNNQYFLMIDWLNCIDDFTLTTQVKPPTQGYVAETCRATLKMDIEWRNQKSQTTCKSITCMIFLMQFL